LSHDDSAAKIEVRDQGKGVDDADLLRLFEPFYKTKDAPDSGTGLGLAIAKRAVRLNGGHIAAENLIDGGLQVTVTLPVDKPS
jgi:signal transduction histidine kinase